MLLLFSLLIDCWQTQVGDMELDEEINPLPAQAKEFAPQYLQHVSLSASWRTTQHGR